MYEYFFINHIKYVSLYILLPLIMVRKQIEHRGVVEQIMSQFVSVSVMQEVACSACAAVALCNSAEKKRKSIEVFVSDPTNYKVGQEVTIVGELRLGLRAVCLAYVVPLFLLIIMLVLTTSLLSSEGLGALISLVSLLSYYIVLYLFRHRLQRYFSFRMKESIITK